jgi:hypothetical protein
MLELHTTFAGDEVVERFHDFRSRASGHNSTIHRGRHCLHVSYGRVDSIVRRRPRGAPISAAGGRVGAPPGVSLRTNTGSGSQEIDVDGSVEAHSGSGSLRIIRAGGLRASTGSGGVTAETITAAFHATTGSGSIRVTRAAGPITAETGSGGIEITQAGRGDVTVSSSSGTVRVRGVRGGLDASTSSGGLHIEGEMAAAWRLSASSGHVTVDLPSGQRFDLDANSSSGRIDVDFPVTVTGRVERRSIRGPVGGGGPLLSVRTSSGGISISEPGIAARLTRRAMRSPDRSVPRVQPE